MKLNLPKGNYNVEILGIYNRALPAKEIEEHFKFWQKQKEVENAISFGKEETIK